MSNVVVFKPRASAHKQTERCITTNYFLTKNHKVRTNRSMHPDRAIGNALMHMQGDHYAAKYCEVVDDRTGLVLCSLMWLARRELVVTYKPNTLNLIRKSGHV